MLINKKGKLFGLINIIDLGIVLLIAVLIVGGIYKIKSINNLKVSDLKVIEVTVGFEEQPKGLIDAIENGDVLQDSVRNIVIGEIVSKKIEKHKELVVDKSGKVSYKEIPDTYDGEVVLKGKAIVDKNGVIVETRQLYIGTEIRLKSNIYVFSSKVVDLKY